MKECLKIFEIKNVKEGDNSPFVTFAVLKSLQKKKTKTGGDFFISEFGDNTGSFIAMAFSDSLPFSILADSVVGDVFKIFGTTDFYQSRFSPKIDSLYKLSGDETNLIKERLIEVSKLNPESMKSEFLEIIDSIENEKLRSTVKNALEIVGDKFYTSTAALRMHHAYAYGLLEHTLKVARLCKQLISLYPFVDSSLVLSGAILHDIGKVEEYSQGLSFDKTRTGVLQGHIVLGYRIVRKAGIMSKLDDDTLEMLEHIILSHQGELEWGAAVLASTPEAVLVSMADNLDARMGSVETALNTVNNSEFSEMIPALKTRIYLGKR